MRPPDEGHGQGWEAIVADDHILLSAVYLAQTRTCNLHGKHAVVRRITRIDHAIPSWGHAASEACGYAAAETALCMCDLCPRPCFQPLELWRR